MFINSWSFHQFSTSACILQVGKLDGIKCLPRIPCLSMSIMPEASPSLALFWYPVSLEGKVLKISVIACLFSLAPAYFDIPKFPSTWFGRQWWALGPQHKGGEGLQGGCLQSLKSRIQNFKNLREILSDTDLLNGIKQDLNSLWPSGYVSVK